MGVLAYVVAWMTFPHIFACETQYACVFPSGKGECETIKPVPIHSFYTHFPKNNNAFQWSELDQAYSICTRRFLPGS